MSDKSYSTSDNGPVSPGSLVGKRIKVESEDEIEDTSFTGSYLNISSHDRAIMKSLCWSLFKGCGKVWAMESNTTRNAGSTKWRIKIGE